MIFVYNYKNISEVAAIDGFNAVLKNQALRYERVFRKPFQLSTRRVGDVLIGQIVVNYDIDGWQPNYENDGYGIVLSGVCEEFLGDKLNSHPIKEIFNSIKNNPKIIADWDGRFSLCTWNNHTKEVIIATGATECANLWYSNGPNGQAYGSRGVPLLKFVGHSIEIDLLGASQFIKAGYVHGTGSLLAKVDRLHSREIVVFANDNDGKPQTYMKLPDYYINDGIEGKGVTELSTIFAENLSTRISKQLSCSKSPLLLMTGGRDSRCIASVLSRLGYRGPAATGGAKKK